MKKSVRILSLALCAVMTAGIFGGCGQGKSSQSAAKSEDTSSPASIRFMWWGGDARHKATLSAIDKYQSENSNVKISGEYSGYSGYQQKLSTQLASGTAPDIMQVDPLWIFDYAKQGNLFADVSKQKQIDISKFSKSFLKDYCTVDGKMQGLPSGAGCSCLLYNKDMFDKLGLPEDGKWTWDDLLTKGTELHQKDSSSYMLLPGVDNARCLFTDYIEQKTGKPFIDAKGNLNVDKAALTDALTYFKKLVDNNVYESFKATSAFANTASQNPDWINGKIAASYDVITSLASNQPTVKVKLAVMDYPTFKDAKAKVVHVSPAQMLCLNSKSKHLSAAAKFLNWFLNSKEAAEILTDCRGIPLSTTQRSQLVSEGKIDSTENQVVTDMTKSDGVAENAFSNNSEILKIQTDALQKIAYNGASPDAVASEMISSYKSKIDEIKSTD